MSERMVWCVDCGHTPFRHDIKAGCFMCGCKRFRLAAVSDTDRDTEGAK